MKPAEPFISDAAAPRVYRGRLFRKYFLLILALVCGVLLVSGGISVYFAYQENKAALAGLQQEKAVAAAARIEDFVLQIEKQLGFAALAQLGAGGVEQRRMEFIKLINQVPAVTDVAQLDSSGRELLTESRLAISTVGSMKDRSAEPAFTGAKPSRTWFGPVFFRKETEPYMTIAVRARGDSGAVTVADVNLKFILDVVTRIKVGQKGKAYVVDATGHLVADPDIGLVLRKTDYSRLEHVAAALSGPGAPQATARLARDMAGNEVLTAYAPIESLGWKVFVEQPVSEVYATLNAAIMRAGVLMVAGLLFSALTALWLARSMVRPIRTLQEGAQRIGEGELEQKIVVNTGDELETLAGRFNDMTARLRESYGSLERKVEERTGELTEALEYQTAISGVLRVISESPTDVAPVFDAILASATRLFDSPFTAVFRYDGRQVHLVATRNWSPEALTDARRIYPGPPNPTMLSGRVILSGKVLTIEDTQADPAYDKATASVGHWRRMIGAPMLKDGIPVGAIVVAWPDPGGIPERQVELLKTFADQAVIAIENVRLISETKEALERQTATAGILRVISGSVTDAQPVFDAIVGSCQRLFQGKAVALALPRESRLEAVAFASDGTAKGEGGFLRPWPFDAGSAAGACILESRVIAVADTVEGVARFPRMRELALALGYRSGLFVPLLREGKAIGCIATLRGTTGEFGDKEVALAQSFADQAVIAIENVRLFNETREALERQTATAEILRVISASVTDTQPVFDAIVGSCQRLFGGMAVNLLLANGDMLERVAVASDGTIKREQGVDRWPLAHDSVSGEAVLTSKVMVVPDREQVYDKFPRTLELATAIGWRSGMFVPLVRDGQATGCLGILRSGTGPFADKDIALAQTFADQAVIAIENARLFREIQEKSRQLEIADKHKSEFLANMSHELRTPLNAVIGFSEVLIEKMFGEVNEKQLDYLQDIHSSGRHLLSLINDILDLSKIEAGRMELDVVAFDVASALSNAMTLVRERAQRHGIALGLHADPQLGAQLGELRADERKFKQILLNLLSNAVKFTPDGGRVDVRARLDSGVLEVSVQDTGIGIAPEDQEAVFEEFRQVGRHYTNKQEGTGLGLALTRRFVELHGGGIRLQSEPGKGSTFTFTIPSQP